MYVDIDVAVSGACFPYIPYCTYLSLGSLEVSENVCEVHAVLVRDLVPARVQSRSLHQFCNGSGG